MRKGYPWETAMMLEVLVFILFITASTADVVLNEKVMNLAARAGNLSALAYVEDPPGKGYKHFGFFDEEPDQALVAKIDGYCFGAFRGTTMTWIDWKQNFQPGKQEVCMSKASEENVDDSNNDLCCMSRTGFYDGYWTGYKDEFEDAIRDCAKSCSNIDECVVLTGHSQGGAIAAVAALLLADLNPYVITFGQPNTIDAPCPIITSSRWYRFINTKESHQYGLMYDPVPFVPGLGADSFGHMILLSNDYTGVAYIGLDAQDFFGPLNVDGFEAHSMVSTTEYPGYLDRIEALMENATYPIRTTGYVPLSFCTEDKECQTEQCSSETSFSFKRCVGVQCKEDSECPKTGRCDSGICLPKLGSCEGCDEDTDCAGGKCILFHCSGNDGLMDDNCICKWGPDCASGRCEGIAPPQCEAQLGIGAHCNEASDCKSGHCGWDFRCAANAEPAKKKTGIIVFVSVASTAFAVLVLGYFFGGKIVGWIRGYQEVPSTTLEV